MSSPLVLDVLGIGFGPANIAVAAALLEKQVCRNPSTPGVHRS